MHMCKTCVAWYEEEAFPDVDACSLCQPYLGYSNKVFRRHCLAADDPPVCEGTKQQVPSMALPSRCPAWHCPAGFKQPLKRQPASRDRRITGTPLACGLGRVPPERVGFRCPSILAFPGPRRPSRSTGSALLLLSLCPHRVLRNVL
jgi:hypothetical protein